jgi:predicted nucleic acid-binding protein
MPLVLDASVTLAWILDDEDHPVARLTFESISGADVLVPPMWWFEVRNTLLMSERNKRSTEERTTTALHHLARLRVFVDSSPDETMIFALSRKHRLTFYDAAYLELAMRKSSQLATLDHALIRSARDENVTLIGD